LLWKKRRGDLPPEKTRGKTDTPKKKTVISYLRADARQDAKGERERREDECTGELFMSKKRQ